MKEKYTILYNKPKSISLKFLSYNVDSTTLGRVRDHWKANPGKFNGHQFGLRRYEEKDGEITLHVSHIRYAYFKYRLHQFKSGTLRIPEEQKLWPVCVANLSYFMEAGKRNFIFGMKIKGNIDGGLVEAIPGGFLDFTHRPGHFHVFRNVRLELEEELGDFRPDDIQYLAFGFDDENQEYAALTIAKINDFNINKVKLSEHEELIIVPEEHLQKILNNEYGEAAPMTRALVSLYLQGTNAQETIQELSSEKQ